MKITHLGLLLGLSAAGLFATGCSKGPDEHHISGMHHEHGSGDHDMMSTDSLEHAAHEAGRYAHDKTQAALDTVDDAARDLRDHRQELEDQVEATAQTAQRNVERSVKSGIRSLKDAAHAFEDSLDDDHGHDHR